MTDADPPARRGDRSKWPYLSLLPFATGAWAPIYAGTQANRRSWLLWGSLWTLLAVAGWVVSIASNGAALGGLLIILAWAGAIATSFSIRRAFEAEFASPLVQAVDRVKARELDRDRARRMAQENPQLALEVGIGRPDIPGAADAGLVDVNNASAAALAQLPGVDGNLVARIVETRGRVGGFSSLEDCGATLDIDGATVEGLRRRVVFLPRAS